MGAGFDALKPVATGKSAALDLSFLPVKGESGISYKGYIKVPTDGEYTFHLQCDSGAEMWLHEAHLIDDDFTHTVAEVTASIRLAAGAHPFWLFYRHKPGPALLSLEYSGPGIKRQPLPPSAFSPFRGDW